MTKTKAPALLLVAHGSRRNASNQEVMALAMQLKTDLQAHFAMVEAAFLELAEPSITQGIRYCADAGATSVVVLPYFLNSGRHVAEDIPAEISKAHQLLPSLDIQLQTHIGAMPEILSLLSKAALKR